MLRDYDQIEKTMDVYYEILDYQLDNFSEDYIEIGDTYNNLGELYLLQEDQISADEYFNLARDIYEKHF